MRYPLDEFWISQGFTPKSNPTHFGIDVATINNASGVELKAPESGVITFVFNTWSEGAYFGGNYIKMKGDSGYSYYMGHAASLSVTAGQRVSKGQILGIVGMTGQADGNHVHFEMYDNHGTAVDASKLLAKGEDTMTQDAAEKTVTYAYRSATNIDPTKEQAIYWVARVRDNPNTVQELLQGLYKANESFRYKATHYDKDTKASQPITTTTLKPGIYEVK